LHDALTILFIEKDIEALKHLKKLRNQNNMTVENATNEVVKKFSSKATQGNNDIEKQDNDNRYTEQYDKLKKQIYHQTYLITKQNEIIRELADKINYQQISMNEGLERIDDK